MSERETPETNVLRDMIATRLKSGQQASAEIGALLRHGFRLERQRDETMLRLANQDDEMIALQGRHDELAEALRELYTCYAVEGTATQLGRACRRAKALVARIDAEKSK